MSNNDKSGLDNVVDLARDARQRLGLDKGRPYQGPPSTNQGPRRKGDPIW